MSKNFISLTFLCLSLSIAGLFGCAGPKGSASYETNSLTTPIDKNKYIIGIGDVVDVLYFRNYSKGGQYYYLNVEDEIKIISYSHPQINSTVTIRPDGKVYLQRVGEVVLLGLTPIEASNYLKEEFSRTLKNPEIAVNVTKFHTVLDELFVSLESDITQQRRRVIVRADGYISLPMIGDIKAMGLSIEELNNEITSKYSDQFPHLDTTVILTSDESQQVLVLGEVYSPGMYHLPSYFGALQAVSLAGGYKDSAKLKSVLLVRKGKDGNPLSKTIDLKEVLSSGDISQDEILRPYDVVYVPKTFIAQVNVFMDQYFTKFLHNIVPPNINLGFTYILHPQTTSNRQTNIIPVDQNN